MFNYLRYNCEQMVAYKLSTYSVREEVISCLQIAPHGRTQSSFRYDKIPESLALVSTLSLF